MNFAKLGNIYDYDKTAFEDGMWVAIDGGRVKVRSHQSAHSKAVRKKLEAPYAAQLRTGRPLPDSVVEDLTIQQMSQSLVIDWEGEAFTDEHGNKIAATPASIEHALRQYPHFRDDLGAMIASRDTFKRVDLEEDAKN